jgi:hypothetical protein
MKGTNMRPLIRVLTVAVATIQIATIGARGDQLYQLDNNAISTALNASEGTEPLDNWFGNVFTVQTGATLINRVDFGIFTTAGTTATIAMYKVTGAGGNPALGATLSYTQNFTPLTGDGTNAFLQSINLTTPVSYNVGDQFLVSILIRNVIANPPNDKYPYLLDTSGVAAGTFWDRAAPNAFNLNNLSGAVPINQPLMAGGFNPGPGHIFIRAFGTVVPEPSVFALSGLALAALIVRNKNRK